MARKQLSSMKVPAVKEETAQQLLSNSPIAYILYKKLKLYRERPVPWRTRNLPIRRLIALLETAILR